MDQQQSFVPQGPMMSSSNQSTQQGSVFGTFTQSSQASVQSPDSSAQNFGQAPASSKSVFGHFKRKIGQNPAVGDWHVTSPKTSIDGKTEIKHGGFDSPKTSQVRHHKDYPNTFQQGDSSIDKVEGNVGNHSLSTVSSPHDDLKRKQDFMKKMVKQSIFGAVQQRRKASIDSPGEGKNTIHKRSFNANSEEASMPTMAKRRSLRDVYPLKATALGRRTSISQEQKLSHASRLLSAAKVPERRIRKMSSSAMAEQVASATTIICHDIPDELNNDTSLRQHFRKFGTIVKIIPNKDKLSATIEFKTHEMAMTAKNHGQHFQGSHHDMKIFYMKKVRKSIEKNPPNIEGFAPLRNTGFPAISHTNIPPIYSGSKAKPIYAKTDSEKLALLEKIDTLLRKKIVRQSDITTAKSCKGTCVDMCPEKERYLRQERKILAIYETRGDRVDHTRAVKEYSRSSADQEEPLPHELRTGETLKMTMHYLLSEMMPRLYDGQIADWYDFVWNRSRAIRKELSVQQISDITAIHINEQCARFHIFCAHELSGQDRMVFDPKINNENLEKTMKSIMDLYRDLYFSSSRKLPLEDSNVAEVFSYYILLNMNRTADVLNELQDLPQSIRYDDKIRLAMEAFTALHNNNYVKFFNVLRRATYLQSCILHRYFAQVRREAVWTISKAFSVTQNQHNRKIVLFPAQDFVNILCFNDSADLQSFCNHYGILLNPDGMLELNRARLQESEGAIPIVPSDVVKSKSENRNVAEVIANCNLPPIQYQPYSSFDENGRYIGEYYSLLNSTESFPETVPAKSPTKALPVGVSMVDIKNIAKQLFHEIIDEMCLSVAKQTHIDLLTTTVYARILEGDLQACIADVVSIAMETIRQEEIKEELRRRKAEEERLRLKRLALEEMRRRELLILEEKKKKERLEKEKGIKMARFRMKISSEVIDDIIETVVRSDARSIADCVIRDHRIELWSNEEVKTVEEAVIFTDVKEICRSTLKVLKVEECLRIKEKVLTRRLKRYFQRWQNKKFMQLKFKMLTQTFPNVPLFRQSKTQIHELLPRQPRHSFSFNPTSFPVDGNTEISVCTPAQIIAQRSKCGVKTEKHISALHKNYSDGACSLPFCDMLEDARLRAGQSSGKLVWKISVRMPFFLVSDKLESWFRRLFFSSNEDACIFGNKLTHVCCQKILDVNAKSDLMGSFSLVLCLSRPDDEEPSKKYWDTVRAELEFLVHNRPAVPAIPLLVVAMGWNCTEEMLDCELGFSLLSFAFSRWTICVLSANEEHILKNYDSVKHGVEFLFKEMPQLPDLKTMKLRDLLEDTLMKKFALPVSQYVFLCKKMFKPPIRPSMQVQFYNFIIESLANIVSNQDLGEISWPPSDFKFEYGECACEVGWNTDEILTQKFNLIMQCKLPPFPDDYEIASIQDVCDVALKYTKLVCPNYPPIVSIVEDRLNTELQKFKDEIYLDDHLYADMAELVNLVDWHSIIDVVICQHLNNTVYYGNDKRELTVTCRVCDLSAMDKYEDFENMLKELDYFALAEVGLEKTTLSAKPQYSEIIDDQFSQLDYSLPESRFDTSWIHGNPIAIETSSLLDEAKLERKLSNMNTERLAALAREPDMEWQL